MMELSMMEAAVGIAVVPESRNNFQEVVAISRDFGHDLLAVARGWRVGTGSS